MKFEAAQHILALLRIEYARLPPEVRSSIRVLCSEDDPWIAVGDKLPKRRRFHIESARVLVSTPSPLERVTTGHYVKDEDSVDEAERAGCWYRDARKPTQGRLTVTHWQPLPSPPLLSSPAA